MKSQQTGGHLLALFTIAIWGVTYIFTKILLNDFTPTEILVIRFAISIGTLFLLSPKILKLRNKRENLTYAAAGLTGVCLYYLLENIALNHTMVSNVGVILAVAPCFTALVNQMFSREKEPLHRSFIIGFLIAIVGIVLISFNGATEFHLSPVGDILAILAAFSWGCYSVLSKKIAGYGYHPIKSTRRILLYGTAFILVCTAVTGFAPDWTALKDPHILINFLFLGVLAGGVCFVTWNMSVKRIGAIKTSVYIYLNPVITVVSSILILHERLTWMSGLGTVLTLVGLLISENIFVHLKRKKRDTVADMMQQN